MIAKLLLALGVIGFMGYAVTKALRDLEWDEDEDAAKLLERIRSGKGGL